jgi:hypothetical protein
MADFDIDFTEFYSKLNVNEKRVQLAMIDGMQDAVDDLKRIATDIAPIDKGILRASGTTKVLPSVTGVVGEVAFSAVENGGSGRFNYALWTHEYDYNLGEQSQAAPGTDGYSVGNKYLERPLKGERDKYVKWWQDAVDKAVN